VANQKKRCVVSHTKDIGMVQGSTRKIYKQKGTGRARHGSVRRGQFVGGGIIFGPNKEKVYKYKINKKVKKIALLNTLALKHQKKSIIVYEHLKIQTNKVKNFLEMYNQNFTSQKALLVDSHFNENVLKSTKNLHSFHRLNVSALNVLDLLSHEKVYFSEASFNTTMKRFM